MKEKKEQSQSKVLEKIPPKKYRELAKNVELLGISLNKGSFNLSPELTLQLVNSLDDAKIKFNDSVDLKANGEQYEILNTWKLVVLLEGVSKEILSIEANYLVIFHSAKLLPNEFWDIFTKTSLHLIVYPYFREYVQNVTSRMNIPPLTMPILLK